MSSKEATTDDLPAAALHLPVRDVPDARDPPGPHRARPPGPRRHPRRPARTFARRGRARVRRTRARLVSCSISSVCGVGDRPGRPEAEHVRRRRDPRLCPGGSGVLPSTQHHGGGHRIHSDHTALDPVGRRPARHRARRKLCAAGFRTKVAAGPESPGRPAPQTRAGLVQPVPDQSHLTPHHRVLRRLKSGRGLARR